MAVRAIQQCQMWESNFLRHEVILSFMILYAVQHLDHTIEKSVPTM